MKPSDIRYEVFHGDRRSVDAQRRLFCDAFPEAVGTDVETLDFYQWKFCSSPFSRKSLECAAWVSDEMLGYYAGIQLDYQMGSKQAKVALVCDVMTHTKARGMGIFTKIGRFSLDHFSAHGVDFTLGYPVRPEVFPGHYKVGWKKAFDLPVYFRVTKPSAVFRHKWLVWALKPIDLMVKVLGLAVRGVTRLSGASSVCLKRVAIDELCAAVGSRELNLKVKQDFPNYLSKTADFFRWRLSAPGTSYDLFLIQTQSTGETLGWVIGRQSTLKGLKCWAMLDFYCVEVKRSKLITVFLELFSCLSKSDVSGVAVMMSATSCKRFKILSSWFLRLPYKFSVIYKTLNESFGPTDFFDSSHWNLMWIDSDDL